MKLLKVAPAAAFWSATAEAGQRTYFGGQYRCGRVINDSGQTARFTTNPNDKNAPNLCKFYNWPKYPNPIKCKQQTLLSNGAAGCGGCGQNRGTDVDGFTFPSVDFLWDNNLVTRGEWIKIDDLTTIRCTGASRPVCRQI
ncbi:hypothetical protein ONS95_007163 [Cadophora gregata]|uniref:uncharacterized protein n=1 Tax=Cadophora gregata TaxID=51156 RepID=UPI0026DCB46E|nr:uncharacterized protein ONS95_007163 [Cadophora gregata]KAK0100712.1 hypothetical protein ONS95_007163 [Cadophora gregata]KAK0117291.1 hypothetical protein ONS96_013124 [Cadophora gregata f. sp. sojae]